MLQKRLAYPTKIGVKSKRKGAPLPFFFGEFMKIYTIDTAYIAYLRTIDKRVPIQFINVVFLILN